MDVISNLIEAIFDNFFIVIVIVAGIIGFFKDKSGKQQQQEQRKTQSKPRPTATPSGSYQRKPAEDPRTSRAKQQAVAAKTVAEQQREQMKQLANKYHTSANQAIGDMSYKAFKKDNNSVKRKKSKSHSRSYGQNQFKRQMSNNLGRKGLINSVVMAEVLGQPRARKPYQSVSVERRRK